MNNLLTLSISETWNNNFKVITFDLEEEKYKALLIPPERFVYDGEVAWDLFGVTQATIVKTKGEFFQSTGSPKVTRYYSKEEMVHFFDKRKTLSPEMINKSNPYGIIVADQVNAIYEPNAGDHKFYVHFTSRRKPYTKILNKDLRWLSYWKHAMESQPGDVSTKILHWKQYVNSKDKKRYVVMYYYEKYNSRWICGFHCL